MNRWAIIENPDVTVSNCFRLSRKFMYHDERRSVGTPVTVLAKRRLGLYAEEYRSCYLGVVPFRLGTIRAT